MTKICFEFMENKMGEMMVFEGVIVMQKDRLVNSRKLNFPNVFLSWNRIINFPQLQ